MDTLVNFITSIIDAIVGAFVAVINAITARSSTLLTLLGIYFKGAYGKR